MRRLYLIDETLTLKSGQYVIVSPLSRKLESDLIAGFDTLHFYSVTNDHQRLSWEDSGTLSFPVFCMYIPMLIPRKAVWLVDQMTHLTDLTSSCYCFSASFFFPLYFSFLTELTESMTYFGTSEQKQASTSGPHFPKAIGLRQ